MIPCDPGSSLYPFSPGAILGIMLLQVLITSQSLPYFFKPAYAYENGRCIEVLLFESSGVHFDFSWEPDT